MARGSINKVILIGTLGRDPEMRFLANGNAVCSLSLATDEGYKDKNTGQQVDKTEWHRVSAFGRLAEVMGEYLKKGGKCYIEGKLQTREYEKDGIKRYSTEIIAHEMAMLSARDSGAADTHGGYQATHQPPASQQQAAPYQQPQQHQQPQRPAQQPQQNGYSQGQQSAAGGFADDVPF